MRVSWWLTIILACAVLSGLFLFSPRGVGVEANGLGIDYEASFYPSIVAISEGSSPYDNPSVFSGPWTFVFLMPLLAVDWQMGFLIVAALTIILIVLAVRAVGGRPFGALLVLFTFYGMSAVVTGNVEWLTLLAIWTPAPLAMLLAMVKPQLGVGIAIYKLAQLRHASPLKRLIYWPLSIAILAATSSYFVFFTQTTSLTTAIWNRALFPYAIPLGLALLTLAYFGRTAAGRLRAGLAAGPYLAPYLMGASYVGVMIALSSSRYWPLLFFGVWGITLLFGGVLGS